MKKCSRKEEVHLNSSDIFVIILSVGHVLSLKIVVVFFVVVAKSYSWKGE